MKFEFSRQFFEKKNPEISNFIKIRPVWAQLFHTDGQTYIHNEANSVAFPQILRTRLKSPSFEHTPRKHTETQNTHSWFGEVRAPHYCDHKIRQMNEGRLEPETLDLVPRNIERLHCADSTETRLTWRHSDDTLSAWPADPHFMLFLLFQLASFSVEGY